MSNIDQSGIFTRHRVTAFFQSELPTRHSSGNRNPVKQTGEAAPYSDIPGFYKAETITEIGKHGFVLTPGRYVGAEAQEDDGEPFAEKYPRLLAELEACFGEGEGLTVVVRERLSAVEVEDAD